MRKKRSVVLIAFFVATIMLLYPIIWTDISHAGAEWPEKGKTIKFIVPFGAGGGVDRFSRNLASFWQKELGTTVVVENYPGGSGLMGAYKFFEAKPDGYTLFIGIQPSLSFNIVKQNAKFKMEELAIINLEQIDPSSIVVKKGSNYKTIFDLVEDVKKQPGKFSMSNVPGCGSGLFTVVFLESLGLKVKVVNYPGGGGPSRTALLGGHVDFMSSSAFGDLSIADRADVLATTYPGQFKPWPNATPINQVFAKYGAEGIPNIGDARMVSVHSILKKEHPDIYKAISDTYAKIYHSKAYQEKMIQLQADNISEFRTPEEAEELSLGMHKLLLKYKHLL